MSGSSKFIVSLLPESAVIANPNRDGEDETKLTRWSDVTFLQYGYLMTTGELGVKTPNFLKEAPEGTVPTHKKGAPTWFLQHDIEVIDELTDVVEFCLGTYHNWKLTSWPGVTFPTGSYCYDALLGTDSGSGVAMFFIRNRMTLGRGILGSVTVFEDKAGKTICFGGQRTTMRLLRSSGRGLI
ncbi:hypothetical protein CERZMDRAFT_84494 [Cercospora zeae-maydis SCOH1-5]|uniref:Uncharacterized protein n=1 Tax=Cercospora zeae-maydis SCOH1-5 TaxID=717836 RepID=A0A6A6FHJ3_9PEZI|nr:hypothetical protein CERZMDRAFT_84494 [Cercospora zeae-maydis SCOH1-5]